MSTLLITGATGFLGHPCVLRACREGMVVHASARKRPTPVSGPFHELDLFDPAAVTDVMCHLRPTHLLHLAWNAIPGVFWTTPENHTWVEASKHLLNEFSRFGGSRAVVAGSCTEYDWQAGGRCHEFETPLRPGTLYGQCKNELREWCEEYSSRTGVSVAWARLFFFYGPREHPARLVSSVARALLAGREAECTAGLHRRDFLHTDDLADALITLLGSAVTGPVNVASGLDVPIRKIVELIADACGRPDLVRLGARPTPAGEPPLLTADVSRLRDEVGWSPKIDLAEGLKSTAAWWRVQPSLPAAA